MFVQNMHRSMWKGVLLVTGLVLLLGSGCSGDGGQEDSAAGKHTAGGSEQAPKADLDAALKKSFKESDAPGVVAAVQTPRYTWVGALGVADRASGESMTPDMHHRIGSVTKTFTATLLLQAAEEGLLSLDDTIDQYVKGVPNGDKITLRQMSDMTSGIASYTADEQWANELLSDPHRVWKPEELAQIGIKGSPLFDPGTEWFYSNTNYTLLGLVLEKVTDKPIGDLYREQIIEPLDLKNTSFPKPSDSSIPEPHAQGYTLQGQSSGGKPIDSTDWSPSEAWTAGQMISTVDDLLVYGRALGTGKGLLSPEKQSERLDSFVSDVPPLNKPPLKGDLAYGIGLGKDHGWVGHNGEIPGYNTYLFYHPKLDAVVAVEVTSDIPSGDCPNDTPTLRGGPQGIRCDLPADRIFRALAEALGKPAPS
ncbi:MAG TPA: serine hydrolase domain-containing protein, partial [Chloroflexia bacterium]|nr:serine hydrolase domain-containing protein [Chloroflexia bacterium]